MVLENKVIYYHDLGTDGKYLILNHKMNNELKYSVYVHVLQNFPNIIGI